MGKTIMANVKPSSLMMTWAGTAGAMFDFSLLEAL